jgi:hypothetical protein
MVIEKFKQGATQAVHERFDKQGRMMPEGVVYVSSWIDPDRSRCFQVMESPDRELLQKWIDAWSDLVDFEVIPVLTSADYWKRFTSPDRGT